MSVRVDLAYEFAVRALDEQRATIDGARTRAGLLLGLASVVNVELGRSAFASGQTPDLMFAMGGGVLAAVGVYLFGTMCLGQKIRLYPPPMSLVKSGTVYDTIEESKIKGTLVAAMDRNRIANEETLQELEIRLKAAMAALVLGATCWLIAIATRG